MDCAPGWHITVVCGCGARAVYSAVVPSLAGARAGRDGWLVDVAVLSRPGEQEAVCPPCAAGATKLRAIG